MEPLQRIPTLSDIQETHESIAYLIHRTPVLKCRSIDDISGARIFFKCENFQKVGAFKMRGAAGAVLRLSEADRQRGVATHSSGNHAQAVARAAKVLGIPAYIVMPENAPQIKRKATEGYGAQIVPCAPTVAARETMLEAVLSRTGAVFIHPYNDYNVIAGQATAAKELLDDVADLDAVIAPIGGGGLMSGTALSTRYLSPNTKVFGAEPAEVNDAYRSLKAGKIEVNETTNTIADGLRTNLGEKTFDIISQHVDDIFTVSEEEIVQAMRLVWERMKIIIEPSCAVPLAAVLRHREVFAGRRVGIILSGGNVDLDHLPF
ncbi:MAG: pyridoxal-phosphate dependent enzyme [Saprospiraceae bacterium]|jgi:threonine dehydratase|nr:pyridoxal-phosphate dependent enzyme [Saprospiraceae bacterium]HRD82256.1 pyridoxal-phosphate dependent enzyme [Saprospiraceae bacterium]